MLKDIEAGYARVARESGHTIGFVIKRKHGSTRTGTMWFATTPGGNEIKCCYTREEAVAAVEEWKAQRP